MRLTSPGIVLQLFMKASSLQKKRAILTVAAIAWGTVTIVMLLAFGQGLRAQMMQGRLGTGENLAVWWPGSTSKTWQGLPTGRRIRVWVQDLDYLRGRMPDVTVIGEMYKGDVILTWRRNTESTRVVGTNWQYGEARNHIPQAGGRFFNARDEAEKRRVIFLGDQTAKDLFKGAEPVGQTILVNDMPYLVIGVMKNKMQMGMYQGPDKSHAVIPITTFAAQWGQQRLNVVLLKVKAPALMKEALNRLATAMGARHQFDPSDPQVMGVWDIAETGETMDKVFLGLQIFLGIVGALTLLIGGIGVANIMYAVVKEKTREIGVQMAIGARRGWITGPFILQGLAYTLLGGLVGTAFAVVVIILVGFIPTEGNRALQFLGKPTLSWQIAAATALVLGFIGTLAGYFPARRAASIDPAETLRYE